MAGLQQGCRGFAVWGRTASEPEQRFLDLQIGEDLIYTYNHEVEAEAVPPEHYTLYAAGSDPASGQLSYYGVRLLDEPATVPKVLHCCLQLHWI